MVHKFVVMKNDQLLTFDKFDDVPSDFDHLIEFVPEIPTGPHTDAQHEEIESWVSKFQKLMEIEYASSSKKR